METNVDPNRKRQREQQGSSEESAGADEDEESREGGVKRPVLVCQQCRYPVVMGNEILTKGIPVLNQAVFMYELELMDKEIACYSCTNEHSTRFDVMRCIPSENVKVSGPVVDQWSWFPGYEYVFLSCEGCGGHMGWGFIKVQPPSVAASVAAAVAALAAVQQTVPTEPPSKGASSCDPDTPPHDNEVARRVRSAAANVATLNYSTMAEFYGFILTKLAPTELTNSEIRKVHESARWPESHGGFNPTNIFNNVVRFVAELRSATSNPHDLGGDAASDVDSGGGRAENEDGEAGGDAEEIELEIEIEPIDHEGAEAGGADNEGAAGSAPGP